MPTRSRACSRRGAAAERAARAPGASWSGAGRRRCAARPPPSARARDRCACGASRTYGQRGWKLQPGGGLMSDGGRPGIGTSASHGVSSRGIERSSPQVYGCSGASKIASFGVLDDPPGVHHRDLVGHLGHHAEVVGDHHDRRVELALQALDQLEDLRLDGDVERGRRLVGDQQLGVVGQRHRDHHALAHAARELVRVGVDARLRGSGMPTRPSISTARSQRLRLGDLARWALHGLRELVAHLVEGMQRRQRVLEDHRDRRCRAGRAAPRRRPPAGRWPVEEDRPEISRCRRSASAPSR